MHVYDLVAASVAELLRRPPTGGDEQPTRVAHPRTGKGPQRHRRGGRRRAGARRCGRVASPGPEGKQQQNPDGQQDGQAYAGGVEHERDPTARRGKSGNLSCRGERSCHHHGMSEHYSFEDRLRALADQVSQSVRRMSEVDVEKLAEMYGSTLSGCATSLMSPASG